MPILNLGDIETYYQTQGQGEPLLLIHGLGSSSRDWEFQIPDFSRHFKTISIDLRGHGQSSKPPGPYSIPQFARDTAHLIKVLNLPSVHILGISLGGMVAFQLALDHPEIVRSLVIVNSTPQLSIQSINERLRYWQRLLIVRLFGLEKMGQVLAERFFTEPNQEEIRQVFIKRWAENSKPSYLAALKAAVGWSVTHRLEDIDAKTLVIGAEWDYFPNDDKVQYTSRIPNAKFILVEGAGHALPAEKPGKFNQIIMDFYQK